MADIQKNWFAARTRDKQELSQRDYLQKLKDEQKLDLDCYLPTQTVVRQLKYRKKRVEVPAIRNLLFIRSTKELACDLANSYGARIFYMRDLQTHSLLVVPDKQMADFQFIMNLDPTAVTFDDVTLAVGDRVQVIKGDFSGVEGEVLTRDSATYVVLRLTGLFAAKVQVPKSYLKKL